MGIPPGPSVLVHSNQDFVLTVFYIVRLYCIRVVAIPLIQPVWASKWSTLFMIKVGEDSLIPNIAH